MADNITLDTTIKRIDKDLLASSLSDETVMMNMKTGDYLGLNEVGTAIWDCLDKPISGRDLCTQILQQFDVDQETCESKTLYFLRLLKEENMIEIL